MMDVSSQIWFECPMNISDWRRIMNECDPANLAVEGTPAKDYDRVSKLIAEKAESCQSDEELSQLIHRICLQSIGDSVHNEREKYRKAADQIWLFVRLKIWRNVFSKCDPAGLIGIGAPADEYDDELAHIILEGLSCQSIDELTCLIHRVFEMAFPSLVCEKYSDLSPDKVEKYRIAAEETRLYLNQDESRREQLADLIRSHRF